jgi:hypothetical protein
MDGVKSSTRQPALWTRRSSLASTAATLAATKVNASPATEKILYIGSGAKGEGAGIHAGMWNPTSATLSNVRLAAPADSPSFLQRQRYGRIFLDSLPPYRLTHEITDVEQFFANPTVPKN